MTTFTLEQLAGRTNEGQSIGTDRRPTPTEEVHWCGECGAIGVTGPHPMPEGSYALRRRHANGPTYMAPPICSGTIVGATLPAPMDGPGAMADRRRSISSAMDGTGHNVKPDVTPGVMARGSFPARTTARRPGNSGKVKVYRLTVHGHAAVRRQDAARRHVWGAGAGAGTYRLRGAVPTLVAGRDFTAPRILNADGTAPKVVKRQRRSRAAILAATGRQAPARRPARRRPAPLTSL